MVVVMPHTANTSECGEVRTLLLLSRIVPKFLDLGQGIEQVLQARTTLSLFPCATPCSLGGLGGALPAVLHCWQAGTGRVWGNWHYQLLSCCCRV